MSTLETPSGKNESTENFPVAQLIRKDKRADVMAYYFFARAADDVSDNPLLDANEKIARLDRFAMALTDPSDQTIPSVTPLRESLAHTGVSPAHALDLLTAFKRDATKLRYATFDELLDYCRYSAAPVGRYLLDLHGESKEAWPANDALCAALQILNHIQDCSKDYAELDRIYLPLDLMEKNGADPTHLSLEHETASPALRQTLDDLLALTAPLIAKARTFSPQIKDMHLRIDTAMIVAIAEKLAKLLAKRDPLCDNVKLSKSAKIGAALIGLYRALTKS